MYILQFCVLMFHFALLFVFTKVFPSHQYQLSSAKYKKVCLELYALNTYTKIVLCECTLVECQVPKKTAPSKNV